MLEKLSSTPNMKQYDEHGSDLQSPPDNLIEQHNQQ